MQSLTSSGSLVSTYDLSVLTLLGWDLGAMERLDSLQLDPGYLIGTGPFTMVQNCSAVQPLLEQLGGGANATNSTDPAEVGRSPFDLLLKNCANTTVVRMPSVCDPVTHSPAQYLACSAVHCTAQALFVKVLILWLSSDVRCCLIRGMCAADC
jgi:hypothetical protein